MHHHQPTDLDLLPTISKEAITQEHIRHQLAIATPTKDRQERALHLVVHHQGAHTIQEVQVQVARTQVIQDQAVQVAQAIRAEVEFIKVEDNLLNIENPP